MAPRFPPPPAPRRTGPALIAALLAVVLVGGAVTGGVVLLRAERERARARAASDAFDSALTTALATRTRALRRHDEKAFLSTVDPTRPALVAAQRRTFRNLVQLPLIDPTYRRTDPTRPAAGGDPGRREIQVALEHRLGTADLLPVSLGYAETWRGGGGTVRLVSASPRPGPGHAGRDNPVDLTALRAVGGGLVTVIAPASLPRARLVEVDRAAERAAVAVRRLWGTRAGPRGFALFLATSPAAKTSWFGGSRVTGAKGFCAPQLAADRAATYGGARVLVDLTSADDDGDLAATLRHEFTHAQAVGVQTVPRGLASEPPYPVWAEEGFASWSEEKDQPLDRSRRLAVLRSSAREGDVTTALPPADRGEFYAADDRVINVNYAKAAMVFRYVAATYGTDRAIAFYVGLASGEPDAARAVLGVPENAFRSGWGAWLTHAIRAG